MIFITINEITIEGQLIADLLPQQYGCLVCPAPGHIALGVASSSQHQSGQVERFHVVHTLAGETD